MADPDSPTPDRLPLTMPIWGLTLPPLDPSVTDPINAAIADELADWP